MRGYRLGKIECSDSKKKWGGGNREEKSGFNSLNHKGRMKGLLQGFGEKALLFSVCHWKRARIMGSF